MKRKTISFMLMLLSVFWFVFPIVAQAATVQIVNRTGWIHSVSYWPYRGTWPDYAVAIGSPDPGMTFTNLGPMTWLFSVNANVGDYNNRWPTYSGEVELIVKDDSGNTLYDQTFNNPQPTADDSRGSLSSWSDIFTFGTPDIHSNGTGTFYCYLRINLIQTNRHNYDNGVSTRTITSGDASVYVGTNSFWPKNGNGSTSQYTSFSSNLTEVDVISQQTLNAANQARDAANNTVQYAQQAQAAAQAAQQAANNVNTIVNNTLTVSAGVVQDSSGTVLTAARAAQAAAQNAVTGIQDTQNKLDNLQTTITNNFNNLQNYLPPTFLKISGYQGATATSASTFRVALDYSNATDYRIAVDGNWGPWSSLSSYESTGYVTATGLNTPGVHQITVELSNGQNGPTVQRSMSVFKL